MLTISQIGRKHGLSRSTLLYYDRLNLVRPTYRTSAGYRLYSAEDDHRVAEVCRYRAAGLPLQEIRRVLDDGEPASRIVGALRRRLAALNEEIAMRRRQQQVVLQLLAPRHRRALREARALTKRKWIAVLRAAGLSDDEMHQWHVAFEAESPSAHQDFLESLGIAPGEVRRIRAASAR